MRCPWFKITTIGRAAGFVLVAAAIVATAIQFRHDDARKTIPLSLSSIQSDPLARELARCRTIGMAAKDDGPCEVAWAENRRRFFTYRPAPSAASAPRADPHVAPKPEGQ